MLSTICCPLHNVHYMLCRHLHVLRTSCVRRQITEDTTLSTTCCPFHVVHYMLSTTYCPLHGFHYMLSTTCCPLHVVHYIMSTTCFVGFGMSCARHVSGGRSQRTHYIVHYMLSTTCCPLHVVQLHISPLHISLFSNLSLLLSSSLSNISASTRCSIVMRPLLFEEYVSSTWTKLYLWT